MLHINKIDVLAVIGACVSLAVIAGFVMWHEQRPITIRGAVLVQNPDPRKQLPIAGVDISTTGDPVTLSSRSDTSGLFVLTLPKRIRQGHPITLQFSHPGYFPLEINSVVQNKLYIIDLVPLKQETVPQSPTTVRITNLRVRYTVLLQTETNVGSAVRTFQIQNTGNILCKGQHPCSPDGKWKAALASGSLDAGPGNVFRDARVSCIAGPCPFTRIESNDFAKDGQTITVTVRNWSDTTTFLLEAEVFRPMVSQTVHWSYPVIFGDHLSFTLPGGAEGVSIEADLDGQTIIFPLGPDLLLNWATCDSGTPEKTRVYRCAVKPGYGFS